ncbi:hypothetical protein BJY00DRAFT_319722 [Aspergillus carlsbadensis]|nr:hypothetical protein BJY00DRAFT_319722 [Aspergillus carlsbadensis]
MKFPTSELTAALTVLVTAANGNPALFHPPDRNDISFTIAVSKTTTTANASIYLQVEAPTTIQWVALAQGDQMAGANMFVVYASSATGVTVSPRAGTGHVPPEYNPNGRVSILPGTGIRNGTMTMRFQCHTCLETYNGSSSASNSSWIWAYKHGSPMDTGNVSAEIEYHDAFGAVLIDLSRVHVTRNGEDGGDPFSDARSINDTPSPSISLSPKAVAHGCLMGLAFVLLFPLFALLVPLSHYTVRPMPITKFHAPLQGLAVLTALAGLGLGAEMWSSHGAAPAAHPIIGIIAVGGLSLVQPTLGWLQHRHFKRMGGKSVSALGHRWFGRAMIVLGIVNGGLGFWWVGSGVEGWKAGMIAFAVVAGVVFVVYVAVIIWILTGGARQPELHGVQDGGGVFGKPLGSATGTEEERKGKAEL